MQRIHAPRVTDSNESLNFDSRLPHARDSRPPDSVACWNRILYFLARRAFPGIAIEKLPLAAGWLACDDDAFVQQT